MSRSCHQPCWQFAHWHQAEHSLASRSYFATVLLTLWENFASHQLLVALMWLAILGVMLLVWHQYTHEHTSSRVLCNVKPFIGSASWKQHADKHNNGSQLGFASDCGHLRHMQVTHQTHYAIWNVTSMQVRFWAMLIWYGPTAAASMSQAQRLVIWQIRHSRHFAWGGSRRGYPL